MFRLELAAALHQLCSEAASEAGMCYTQRGGRIHDSTRLPIAHSVFVKQVEIKCPYTI